MKTIRTIVTIIIILVIFYFLTANLIKNWQNIPFDSLHFNSVNLIVSFVFLVLNFLLFIQGWRCIVHRLGGAVTYKTSFWLISLSQVAKYIPGGIWFTLGRVYLAKDMKLKAEIIALSVVIETVLTFLVCILLFLLSIVFSEQHTPAHSLFVIPIFIIFLIILQPSILNKLINFALKIFKRPAIHLSMSYTQLLTLSLYFLGFLIAQLIGFYFLINSIYPLAISKMFELITAYTVSWMAGFIVIFAPSGLGVREGVMTLLLSPILPTPLAIAISFIARVWMIVFEIVIFFVGLIVKKSDYQEH
jgi:uncharacterized membrane protein YbhN (UPF0104 family)